MINHSRALVAVLLILVAATPAQAQIPTGPLLATASGQVSDLFQCGAKGDGVTDDSTAIQACFTNSNGGVFVPSAMFAFSKTLNVPANVRVFGNGQTSILKYTGSGTALRIDPGSGVCTQWRTMLQTLQVTTTSGAVGVGMKDVYEVKLWGVVVTGFSTAGIQGAATVSTGCTFSIELLGNIIRNNPGTGVLLTGANLHRSWTIISNRIQGNQGIGGIWVNAQLLSGLIVGNVIEGNTTQEIVFGNDVRGISIQGNHFETNVAANNTIVCQGSGGAACHALVIEGNGFYNNAASASGRALYISNTGSGGNVGIVFRGNHVVGYGNLTNPAVDFNSTVCTHCDLSGNVFDNTVTRKIGNLAVGSTVTTVVPNSRTTLTYRARLVVDASLASEFEVVPTDGMAFAFSVPKNATPGQRMTIRIKNTFGTLGGATFTGEPGGFRIGAAWTQPAKGFSRSIEFIYDGTNWIEVGRTATDVAN
jgi:Pectate lyase superfamily protein